MTAGSVRPPRENDVTSDSDSDYEEISRPSEEVSGSSEGEESESEDEEVADPPDDLNRQPRRDHPPRERQQPQWLRGEEWERN